MLESSTNRAEPPRSAWRRRILTGILLAACALPGPSCYSATGRRGYAPRFITVDFAEPTRIALEYPSTASEAPLLVVDDVTRIRGRMISSVYDTLHVAVFDLTLARVSPGTESPVIRVGTHGAVSPTATIIVSDGVHVRAPRSATPWRPEQSLIVLLPLLYLGMMLR